MIRTQSIIVVAALLVFGTAATAGAANLPYDGHYWKKCSTGEKLFFIHGVMSGVLLGQDRVVGYGAADRGTKTVAPECQHALVGLVNTLERQIERWDRNEFLEALDAFYNDPDHLDLNLKWAVMVVIAKLQGAPSEDVRNPAGPQSHSSP